MRSNPLIKRFSYSTLRRSRFGVYATIYGVVIALIFFINYLLFRYVGAFPDSAALFESIFYQLFTVMGLILFVWASYNTGGAIPNEISEKSYDFFRMLPLTPAEKSLGIMIGRNLAVLLIGAVNVLLLAISAVLGRISPPVIAQYLLALVGIAALMNTYALLWSQRLKGSKRKEGTIGHLILLIILTWFFISFVSGTLPEIVQHRVWFYGIQVPALVTVSFVTFYFAVWAFAGTLRRFRAESEPLFHRAYAFLFLFLFQIIIFGFALRYLEDRRGAAALFWLATVLVLLVVAELSSRNLQQYHELSGALQEDLKSRSKTFTGMLLRSNVFFSLVFFAAWFAVSLVVLSGSVVGFADTVALLAVTFTIYLFIVFLLEIYLLYSSGSVKIGGLVFFLLVLYFVLPWIVGGILEMPAIYGLSPTALLWFLIEGPPYDTPLWLIGLYNIGLSSPIAVIIGRRYKGIVDAHV